MKVKKGNFGYIMSERIFIIILTLANLALCIGCYYLGIYIAGSNKNLLTYVAILGVLPMAKFAVRAVMLIKAKGCSDELHSEIVSKELPVDFYDLYMTAYKDCFPFSTLTFKKNNLILFSECEKLDIKKAEEHVSTVVKNAGFNDITVKIYTYNERDKYLQRLSELKNLEGDAFPEFLKDSLINVAL